MTATWQQGGGLFERRGERILRDRLPCSVCVRGAVSFVWEVDAGDRSGW